MGSQPLQRGLMTMRLPACLGDKAGVPHHG